MLMRLVPSDARGEAILGDLSEEHASYARRHSERTAAIWYGLVGLRVGLHMFGPESRTERPGEKEIRR